MPISLLFHAAAARGTDVIAEIALVELFDLQVALSRSPRLL